MSIRATDISALRAEPTSGFDTDVVQTAYVATVGDWYSFSLGTSLTPASDVVVNSSDGRGQWSRMGVTNSTFLSAPYGNVTAGNATLSNLAVTGLPSFTTHAWDRPMGDYVLQPNTGFPSDGKVLVSAADGRQWVYATRPFAASPTPQNTGRVAGRPLNPVLIEWSPLVSFDTSHAVTWSAGQYTEIKVKVQNVSGTATGFTVTLTGLTGTYKALSTSQASSAPGTIGGVGNNTAWSIGMGPFPWKLRGEFDLDAGGPRMGVLNTISPNGLGAGVMLTYEMTCQNDDATNDITGINVAFSGGYCTGWMEVWGVPYIAAPTTTIMFLGDSITEGGPSGGFRRKIITELGQFMPKGSLTTDPPTAPYPLARIQHEGHAGQQSSYFVANIASLWAANPSAFVTFLIGANDAIAGTPATTTAANIGTVLDYIHAQSPNTFIWVGLVTNATSAQTSWNALLDAQRPLVSAVCATRPWTKAVSLPHLPDAQLDGSVHPVNAAAYDVVADAWLLAMRPA